MQTQNFPTSATSALMNVLDRRAFRAYRRIGFALMCAASCAQCSAPDVRVIETRNNQTAQVGIGFIENRDLRFSPFTGKDFENMLEFEFLKNGYTIEDLDFDPLRGVAGESETKSVEDAAPAAEPAPVPDTKTKPETGSQPERIRGDEESGEEPAPDPDDARDQTYSDNTFPLRGQTTPVGAALRSRTDEALAQVGSGAGAQNQKAQPEFPYRIYDDTYHLLPERLRAIAGEHAAPAPEERFDNRHLSMEEIRTLAKSNTFDYYIQGAISRTETGLLLETEESTLVFLEIFDADGRRVGAINMSIDDATLRQASFLQTISERIALAFHRTIHDGAGR